MKSSNDPLALRVGAKSHRGRVREENQDRISRFRSPFGEVFVVADGMGGHEAGGLAAELTISGLQQHLDQQSPAAGPDEALRQAARRANAEIVHQAEAGSQDRTMGATAVLALLADGRVWVAHAGDSRAYLFREGTLSRLTTDHTRVQEWVDGGILTEEQARDHPDAAIVTRAFGHEEEMTVDVGEPVVLAGGDRLLLCSDGLSGYVGDAEIERVLRATYNAQEATDRLIELALAAGGEDNVSVQLLAFGARPSSPSVEPSPEPAPRRPEPEPRRPERPPRRRWLSTVLVALAAFVAGLVVPLVVRPFISAPEAPVQPLPPEPQRTPPPPPPPSPAPPAPVSFQILFGVDSEAVQEMVLRASGISGFELREMPDVPPSLKSGVLYFRPEAEDRAQEVATELGLPREPLPELSEEWMVGSLVVWVEGPEEEEAPEPVQGSEDPAVADPGAGGPESAEPESSAGPGPPPPVPGGAAAPESETEPGSGDSLETPPPNPDRAAAGGEPGSGSGDSATAVPGSEGATPEGREPTPGATEPEAAATVPEEAAAENGEPTSGTTEPEAAATAPEEAVAENGEPAPEPTEPETAPAPVPEEAVAENGEPAPGATEPETAATDPEEAAAENGEPALGPTEPEVEGLDPPTSSDDGEEPEGGGGDRAAGDESQRGSGGRR